MTATLPVTDPSTEAPAPTRSRRGVLSWVLFAVLLAMWFVALRPQFLGGSTGYVVVSGTSMEPTFDNKDLVLVRRHATYEVGDVIAYRIPKGEPGEGLQVIHRIVGGSAEEGYVTQGDNRAFEDRWRPKPADVIGSQAYHLPWVGRVFGFVRQPFSLGLLAGVLTVALLWRDEDDDEPEALPERGAGGNLTNSAKPTLDNSHFVR